MNHRAPLMKSLLAAGLPVASSCGGDGICGKCRLQVVSHPENLTPPTEIEMKRMRELHLAHQERLSCQAMVIGDIAIESSYW